MVDIPGWVWNWEGLVKMALAIGLVMSLVLYWFCIHRLFYWHGRGIPYVTARPIFGRIGDVELGRKAIGEVYAEIYRRGKGERLVGFHHLTQPCILLRDPDLVKKVFVTNCKHFPSVGGRPLLSLGGAQWRRRCLYQGLTDQNIREIFALFPEVCDVLRYHVFLEVKGGGWVVELRELCTNFATSAMSSCAFGVPCDAINHPDAELGRMVRALLSPVAFLGIPRMAKLLREPPVPRQVTEFFLRVVSEEVVRRERQRVERNDYLQILMRLWYEGKLSSDETVGEETDINRNTFRRNTDHVINTEGPVRYMGDISAAAMDFVCEGIEITASLLSFTLFELAHNHEVQERLRKEVVEVLNRNEGIVTFHALQNMPYLDMVLLEVLRLYPPALFLMRTCAKSHKFSNLLGGNEKGEFTMDKDIPVIVPVYGLHMDTLYYPNSKWFDPSRFSAEEMRGRKHFTYYPYGDGPRMCIGVKFSALLVKAAIAYLIPLFNFIPHENTSRPITLDPNYSIAVSQGGLWIQMQKI